MICDADDVIGVGKSRVGKYGYTAVYSGAGTAGTAQVLVLLVLDCWYWTAGTGTVVPFC